jgi:hypothetical protein
MIPQVINPLITKIDNDDARLKMADGPLKCEIAELTAQDSKPDVNDSESLIAMVLADPDNIQTAPDNNAKLKAAWQKRAAIDAARQSLKPKRAAAVRDAGTAILQSPEVQKTHGEIMQRLTTGLVEASKAYVQLFDLSRELRARDIGFRCGICELMPLDLLGAPGPYSPLAGFLRAAVAANYLKASAVPNELR